MTPNFTQPAIVFSAAGRNTRDEVHAARPLVRSDRVQGDEAAAVSLSRDEGSDDVADAGALFAACRHSIESASKLIKRAPSTAVRRRGFTITEVIVSMILLGTVIGIVVPLTKRAIDQREQAQIRRAALMELSNTLERLVADPAAGPPPGEQREFPLPDRMASQFDEPRLTVAKVSFDDDVPGHRFDASLTWNAPNGRRSSPIRLSAFAFDSTAERETP